MKHNPYQKSWKLLHNLLNDRILKEKKLSFISTYRLYEIKSVSMTPHVSSSWEKVLDSIIKELIVTSNTNVTAPTVIDAIAVSMKAKSNNLTKEFKVYTRRCRCDRWLDQTVIP